MSPLPFCANACGRPVDAIEHAFCGEACEHEYYAAERRRRIVESEGAEKPRELRGPDLLAESEGPSGRRPATTAHGPECTPDARVSTGALPSFSVAQRHALRDLWPNEGDRFQEPHVRAQLKELVRAGFLRVAWAYDSSGEVARVWKYTDKGRAIAREEQAKVVDATADTQWPEQLASGGAA